MDRKIALAVTVGGVLVISGAHAQGYFPFDEIPGLDSEPTVEIDLDPTMMRFFGEATKGEAAEAASALEGVSNVRVRVYEDFTGGAEADVLKFVDDTSRTLERDGWRSVVRINDGGERVRIFMKPAEGGANAGMIEGLTLMIVDPGSEAVFINVAGTIKPEQLGQIAGAVPMASAFGMIPGVGSQKNAEDSDE